MEVFSVFQHCIVGASPAAPLGTIQPERQTISKRFVVHAVCFVPYREFVIFIFVLQTFLPSDYLIEISRNVSLAVVTYCTVYL